MGIIAQLTTNSIKENKKRTIVTIIGVALSCALMIAVGGMFASFQQMMKDLLEVINMIANTLMNY